MTRKPELKQFGDLTADDFARHPVWIACHVADYDEPWHDETDEETFRPRLGELPAGPEEGMLLVRATATLADGQQHPAFLTPGFEGDDLGTLQPQLLLGGRIFSFWGGGPGVSEQGRREFYQAIGKPVEAVFPIRFSVDPALSGGSTQAVVEGFYKLSGARAEVVR